MKRKSETEVVEGNGFTEPERTRLMLWGDKRMGVRGLKGRMDRTERILIALTGMEALVLLILLGHLGMDFSGSGGLVGAILRGLFGG